MSAIHSADVLVLVISSIAAFGLSRFLSRPLSRDKSVTAGAVAIGAVGAEAGDAAIDETRVDLAQALIIELQPMLHIGPEVLDHDVGVLDQPVQDLERLRLLEIEGDAPLVAVQVLEIGAVPRAAEPAIALGRFDLDDFRAPIGELAHAGGAGAHARQIDDLEAGKRELAHDASLICATLCGSISSQTLSSISKISPGGAATRSGGPPAPGATR